MSMVEHRYFDGGQRQSKPPSSTSTRNNFCKLTPGRMTSGGYNFQKNKENFHTPPPTGSKRYQTNSSNPQTVPPSAANRVQSSCDPAGRGAQGQPSTRRPGGPYFPQNKASSNAPPPHRAQSGSQSFQSFSQMERQQASFPPGRAVEPAPHQVSHPAPLINEVISKSCLLCILDRVQKQSPHPHVCPYKGRVTFLVS